MPEKQLFLTISNSAALKKHKQTKTRKTPRRFHEKFTKFMRKVFSRKNIRRKGFSWRKKQLFWPFSMDVRSGILWGRLSPVLLSGPGLGRALLHHRQLQLMGLVQPGVECWGLLSKCCYKK